MKKLISVLLMVMLVASFTVSAYAADATVSVKAPSEAAVDDTITVTVDITGNPGFMSGLIKLVYDETQLKLDSMTGGLFKGDMNPASGIGNHAGATAETQDGTLFTATFIVLASGTVNVSAEVREMCAEGGTDYAGSVVVSGSSITVPEAGGDDQHTHSYTYTDNGDGTHNGACDCGKDPVTNEEHDWANGEECVKCGALKPVEHTHSYTYTDNGDGTHNGVCECGEDPVTNEEHDWANGEECVKCGAKKPGTTPGGDQGGEEEPNPTEKPDGGNKPSGGDKPSGGNKPSGDSKPGNKAPKTGDESNFVLWAVILLVACGGVAVVVTSRKKKD